MKRWCLAVGNPRAALVCKAPPTWPMCDMEPGTALRFTTHGYPLREPHGPALTSVLFLVPLLLWARHSLPPLGPSGMLGPHTVSWCCLVCFSLTMLPRQCHATTCPRYWGNSIREASLISFLPLPNRSPPLLRTLHVTVRPLVTSLPLRFTAPFYICIIISLYLSLLYIILHHTRLSLFWN